MESLFFIVPLQSGQWHLSKCITENAEREGIAFGLQAAKRYMTESEARTARDAWAAWYVKRRPQLTAPVHGRRPGSRRGGKKHKVNNQRRRERERQAT